MTLLQRIVAHVSILSDLIWSNMPEHSVLELESLVMKNPEVSWTRHKEWLTWTSEEQGKSWSGQRVIKSRFAATWAVCVFLDTRIQTEDTAELVGLSYSAVVVVTDRLFYKSRTSWRWPHMSVSASFVPWLKTVTSIYHQVDSKPGGFSVPNCLI